MRVEASLAGIPHPRDRHEIVGHAAPRRAFVEAIESERLHHAWLIGGTEGIGKATLAYRVARRLLAPPSERLPGGDGLGVDPAGRTARQISAGAHPNLVVLQRGAGEGEKAAPRTVSVEAVRRALGFFASTAADGGRRICIIDPVDDLTPQAANALLKTIEEPPARAVILVVSHAPARVLPTVRSRCRKLPLAPLSTLEVRSVLDAIGGRDAEGELAARAAELSEGSVGRALAFLDARRIRLVDEIRTLLDALPDTAPRRVLDLSEKLADRRSADEFPLALDTIAAWLSERVQAGQHLGAARLAPLAEVCEKVAEAARAVETYNLDRRAFIVATFGDLAEAVRRAA